MEAEAEQQIKREQTPPPEIKKNSARDTSLKKQYLLKNTEPSPEGIKLHMVAEAVNM